MKEFLIVLWLLIGAISIFRSYYGMQKQWFDEFNSTMEEDHCISHKLFLICSPVFILGGLLTFAVLTLTLPQSWYWNKSK